MADDYIWELVSKKAANEATAKELLELDILLRENPFIHHNVKILFEWWGKEEPNPAENTPAQALFDKIMAAIKNTSAEKS